MADLTRKLDFDHDVDFVKASSYGASLTANEVIFNVKMKFDVKGRDIVLVDELVESGRTFGALAEKLRELGASSVKTLCLVDKPGCRTGAEASRLPFFASAFLSSALASAMFCPSSSLHLVLPPSLSVTFTVLKRLWWCVQKEALLSTTAR